MQPTTPWIIRTICIYIHAAQTEHASDQTNAGRLGKLNKHHPCKAYLCVWKYVHALKRDSSRVRLAFRVRLLCLTTRKRGEVCVRPTRLPGEHALLLLAWRSNLQHENHSLPCDFHFGGDIYAVYYIYVLPKGTLGQSLRGSPSCRTPPRLRLRRKYGVKTGWRITPRQPAHDENLRHPSRLSHA